MSVIPYQTIKRLCTHPRERIGRIFLKEPLPMIVNWVERGDHEETGCSFGLGPSSYDVRIDRDLVLHPREFEIVGTMEDFNIPIDICADVKDKSTYARLGVSGFNTYLDAGWSGNLTLELVNHSTRSVLVPRGAPILQVVFSRLEEPTEFPYPEDAKYQRQAAGGVPALKKF